MPEQLTHQEYVAAQRAHAAAVARDAVAGRLTVLEAVRLIGSSHELELEGDSDLAALDIVRDDTESLPIGSERQNWLPDALVRKGDEVAKAEEWARGVALEALRNIASRFGAA
jgi:hypothetical protein